MVIVSGIKIIKPNPAKGPYSRDWVGYIDLYGSLQFKDSGEFLRIEDQSGAPGLQFTITSIDSGNGRSGFIARLYSGYKPGYENRGRPGGKLGQYIFHLERMASIIINNIDLPRLMAQQQRLVQVYSCSIEYSAGAVRVISAPVPVGGAL